MLQAQAAAEGDSGLIGDVKTILVEHGLIPLQSPTAAAIARGRVRMIFRDAVNDDVAPDHMTM